jgi:hypothetical protein
MSKEMKGAGRIEQARQTRPVFYHETDDLGRSAVGVTSGQRALMRPLSPAGTQSDSDVSWNPQRSVIFNQPLSYNLRKSVQPSTQAVGEEWQAAHKRRRTLTRRALAESPANTRRERVTQSNKAALGENMQSVLHFLEVTPSSQQ